MERDGRLEILAYSTACLALILVMDALVEPLRWVALALVVGALAAINHSYRRLWDRLRALESRSGTRDSPPDPESR